MKTFGHALMLGLTFACSSLRISGNAADFLENQYLIGKKVILVGHPNCGFTRYMLENFPPTISPKLKQHGLIVGPINPRYAPEELGDLISWNKSHDMAIIPVSQTLTMKNVQLNQIPVFLFLDEGVLMKKQVG